MDHGTQDDLTALLDAARAGGEDAVVRDDTPKLGPGL